MNFTDADPTMNKRIREYETKQFMGGDDPNQPVSIEKTDIQGECSMKAARLALTLGEEIGKLSYLSLKSRRIPLCPVPVNTCLTQPKKLPILTTCQNRKSKRAAASVKKVPVPFANGPLEDTTSDNDPSITSVITTPGVPSKLFCNIPSITVANAKSISMSICHPSHRRSQITRTLLSNSPSDSLLTMVCLTAMPVGIFGETIVFSFPLPPSKIGSRRREKKMYSKIETDEYLDWAFENFSGYIAIDEVYDGPFCILSVVDNREYKRLIFRVLDHDPTAADILELLQSFQQILKRHELILYGITTDGSSLYTEPVRTVCPGVRHQICEFHVKKEINKSVLKAVAQVRRELEKTKTKRSKRGRPSTKEEKAIIRKNERIQSKIGALFENRYLFVQKELTAKERKKFQEITRGQPELRKLREIVEEVYRLYDRRCRRVTAVDKLRKLRERLQRFKRLSAVLKKIESPTLARSLVFLDDKNLPSTSNAVERGNRRFRKMQKTVYRVRTYGNIINRVALDMFRDSRLPLRRKVVQWMHSVRNE
jgi:hypothetical protein